jgi:hypothetical protein
MSCGNAVLFIQLCMDRSVVSNAGYINRTPPPHVLFT